MQHVYIVPYNPQWPADFARERRAIHSALGQLVTAIHHIGSTAIPDMPAKPIIDILLVAPNLPALDAHDALSRDLGYEAMGEFGIPGRRYFRKNDSTGNRTHQIHAFAPASPHIARHLAFRDYLTAHPPRAAEYAALKRDLAKRFPHDIEAYCEGKDTFVQQTDTLAAAWRSATLR